MSADKHKPTSSRGFNLVEAAIVLGVVGLVIGGIWVAAAEVQKNRKLSVAATSIGQVVEQTRILFKNMPISGQFVSVDVMASMPNAVDPSMVRNNNEFFMPRFSADGSGDTAIIVNVHPDTIQVSFETSGRLDCILLGPYLATRLRPNQIVYEGSENEFSVATVEAANSGCQFNGDIIMRFSR